MCELGGPPDDMDANSRMGIVRRVWQCQVELRSAVRNIFVLVFSMTAVVVAAVSVVSRPVSVRSPEREGGNRVRNAEYEIDGRLPHQSGFHCNLQESTCFCSPTSTVVFLGNARFCLNTPGPRSLRWMVRTTLLVEKWRGSRPTI